MNSLDITMQCPKQTGWHAADVRMLITTIRDLKLDLDLALKDLKLNLDL